MSFSGEVKKELCRHKYPQERDEYARFCGMLLFAHRGESGVQLVTESAEVAALFRRAAAKRLPGAETPVPDRPGRQHAVSLGPPAAALWDELTVPLGGERRIDVDRWMPSFGAFLAGAFLCCGALSDPEKEYRLEFYADSEALADDLAALLSEFGYIPSRGARSDFAVVYLKDSTAIEELLTAMGATSAVLELMNVKVLRDLRNKVNRITNCESANIERMASSAARELAAIERIEAAGALGDLQGELAAVAILRRDNPEASLRELAQLLPGGGSHTGIRYKLRKIIAFAEQL